MWLPTILCLVIISSSYGLHMTEPPCPAATTRNEPQERWFSARLDHFHASNTEQFNMRFYFNDEFNGSDHILIQVGGEWAISPGWLQAGLMYELAQELKAAMIYTEHRYYGQTRPTENTAVSNLRYLTVDQALGDLAQFIEYVHSDQFENGKYKNATIGLVGCSYAGSMATWMKLAYPHLVDVAFSDSGPLVAQEDFPEYLEVITEALRSQGGEDCVTSVEEAMQGLQQLLDTDSAAASTMFNTCTPLTSVLLDRATFSWFGITESFARLVQYATPGDIVGACAVLTNANQTANPTQRLANWITAQSWNQPCIETRYTEVVAAHTDTSFDAQDSVMRLWTYQTCVEYGWFQTTTSNQQPFLSTVPLEYFHQMCKDFFSTYFDEERLRYGIRRTNIMFAGHSYLPDDVVSVAGGADPWSPMGPNADHATPRSPVYVVDGISHCRAVQRTDSAETTELRETMNNVKSFMYRRLTGEEGPWQSSGAVATSVTLMTTIIALVVAVL